MTLIVRPMTDLERSMVQIDAADVHIFVEPENNEKTEAAFFYLSDKPQQFFVKLVSAREEKTAVGIVLHKFSPDTKTADNVEALAQKNRIVWIDPEKNRLFVHEALESDIVRQAHRLNHIFFEVHNGYSELIQPNKRLEIHLTKTERYSTMTNRFLALAPRKEQQAKKEFADVPGQRQTCCIIQ